MNDVNMRFDLLKLNGLKLRHLLDVPQNEKCYNGPLVMYIVGRSEINSYNEKWSTP